MRIFMVGARKCSGEESALEASEGRVQGFSPPRPDHRQAAPLCYPIMKENKRRYHTYSAYKFSQIIGVAEGDGHYSLKNTNL